MDEAFIIMQIGNADLDAVCDRAIVPAIEGAGLVARRVDRHNTGDLLKSEIISFIERSLIIVADLTNERPNCYLEVGYAMGLGKKQHLILTAREDHHHGSENFRREGPRVHFDLEGYDILFWSRDRLDDFRQRLQVRITRRVAIVRPSAATAAKPPVDVAWLDERRQEALDGLHEAGRAGYMEVVATVAGTETWSQGELLAAHTEAQVHTFGWPVAPVIDRPEFRPRPTADGITAEVASGSYDYWFLRRNGSLYVLGSLFEDERREGALFFNTRIVRVTEALLMLSRLYARLGVSERTPVTVRVRHGGLRDRRMTAVGNRIMSYERTTTEDIVSGEITRPLREIESDLVRCVKELLAPLFVVFEFMTVPDEIYEDIVNRFVAGEVS